MTKNVGNVYKIWQKYLSLRDEWVPLKMVCFRELILKLIIKDKI